MRTTQEQTLHWKGSAEMVPSFLRFGTRKCATRYIRQNGGAGQPRQKLTESFGQLNNIPVVTDSQPDYDVTLALARQHNLSLYDALYLELAKRCNVELATLETRLGSAAAREGLLMTTA